MKRLGFILILAFLTAAAFSFGSLDRLVKLQLTLEHPLADEQLRALTLPLPFVQPVLLDLNRSEHIRLTVQGNGADHVGVINLEVEGGSVELIPDANVRSKRSECFPNEKSSCRVTVQVTGDAPVSFRLVPTDGKVVVNKFDFEPVTSKRHGAANGQTIFLGFGLLLLIGPALVWLRRWPGAEQYALTICGLVWIGYASPMGLLISSAFVLLGYFSILYISRSQHCRSRSVFTAVVGIAVVVLVLKFATPVIAAAFANPGGLSLAFPLGISYLAIRIVDLLLAAYARTLKGFNLLDFLSFVLLPHTLPAGPIQLYGDYLHARIQMYSFVDFIAGAARVFMGFAKKLIADSILLPIVATQMNVFLTDAGDMQVATVIMLLCNLLYIYIDFSAYCDMGIGSARAGGRRLPENFDWPLIRCGVRAYWQHWHMTLSQWVMRRVYFPAFLTSHSSFLSLMASMLVIGLWHAPTICWALWALHHSVILAVESKLFSDSKTRLKILIVPHFQLKKYLKYIGGMIFMLVWVSIGHSLTLFSDPRTALMCYWTAISAPFQLLYSLFQLVSS